MKNSERAELVVSLVKSVEDSLRRREELKDTIRPGYNVQNSDSNESIIRRCIAAREELLHIIKRNEGGVEMREVRLIDANALLDSVRGKAFSGTKLCATAAAVVVESIDNAPTINPVNTPDVCRCEECELWNDWDKVGKESLGTLRCSCGHWSTGGGHATYTAPNDFCSYGLKKGKE